jgi:C1A family cysteine protease
MATDTINAYNRILSKFGLKAKDFTSQLCDNAAKHEAIKEQLRNGKIVNSGMYLDAPEFSSGGHYAKDKEGNDITKFEKGHLVNIVGYDDVRGEWIVNDSNKCTDTVFALHNPLT